MMALLRKERGVCRWREALVFFRRGREAGFHGKREIERREQIDREGERDQDYIYFVTAH
jgi:hypothetical protein